MASQDVESIDKLADKIASMVGESSAADAALEMPSQNVGVALGILARRDHSEYELTEKLKKKSLSDENINAILKYCQQKNYLDDARFAIQYVQYRKRSGFGPLRIEQELKVKKVKSDTIQTALFEQDIDWISQAFEAWEKKFKAKASDRKTQAKHARFLQQRGFSSSEFNFIF